MSQESQREVRCQLCGGEVETGFVLDHTHGGKIPAEWVSGEPVPSFWRGTSVRNATLRPMEAFRCTRCGYVMLFARKISE